VRPYNIFFGLTLLFGLAGFLGLAGGIIGIILWVFSAIFLVLGIIAFVTRAKAEGKTSNQA
jgi:uncharacterized membrane protein